MNPRDLPAEIEYLVHERLGILGHLDAATTPREAENTVRRQVHQEVQKAWPEVYAKAVEIGIVTA